ncbi:MAG: CBS domain-containing protein [Desulforhopalus sp.]
MYIVEYMTSDPITISTDVYLPEARLLLNEYHIRHLPVVDRDNKLIGIVTDRDLRSAYPSSVTSRKDKSLAFEQVEKTKVEDMMTTSCSTLGLDSTLDDALIIFDRDKVGGIPVVSDDDVVIGMFSLLDLTAAYRKLFGVAEDGSILVGIEDDDRDNILSEIVVLLEQNGILLTRLIRLVEKNEVTKIFMRINSRNPSGVYKLLRSRGFSFIKP